MSAPVFSPDQNNQSGRLLQMVCKQMACACINVLGLQMQEGTTHFCSRVLLRSEGYRAVSAHQNPYGYHMDQMPLWKVHFQVFLKKEMMPGHWVW